MLRRVISGGQTGVDQAALRAAKAAGLETGGWMPLGWLTEDGPRPDFASLYGMTECDRPGYPARTWSNARDSEATLCIIGSPAAAGCSGMQATQKALDHFRRLSHWVLIGDTQPEQAVAWIRQHRIAVLNVSGNRESGAPGIGAWAEHYLGEVFRLLREG
jgi:hypothetical protein